MAAVAKKIKCERWIVILKEERGYKGNCKEIPRWMIEASRWVNGDGQGDR